VSKKKGKKFVIQGTTPESPLELARSARRRGLKGGASSSSFKSTSAVKGKGGEIEAVRKNSGSASPGVWLFLVKLKGGDFRTFFPRGPSVDDGLGARMNNARRIFNQGS